MRNIPPQHYSSQHPPPSQQRNAAQESVGRGDRFLVGFRARSNKRYHIIIPPSNTQPDAWLIKIVSGWEAIFGTEAV
jgi:hypothetical protein